MPIITDAKNEEMLQTNRPTDYENNLNDIKINSNDRKNNKAGQIDEPTDGPTYQGLVSHVRDYNKKTDQFGMCKRASYLQRFATPCYSFLQHCIRLISKLFLSLSAPFM